MNKKIRSDYTVAAGVILFVYWVQSIWTVTFYHVLTRLNYVLFVGISLWKRSKIKSNTEIKCRECIDDAVSNEYKTFKDRASFLMNNDAVSFCLLVWMTRDQAAMRGAPWTLYLLAAALIIIGAGIKLWAARVLGTKGYYWYDFFAPVKSDGCKGGPYRFLSNPMYSVGYLHAYGIAILFCSKIGLWAAVFDHVAILAFHFLVERPHVRKLYSENK